MKNKETALKVVSVITENYVDTLMVGIAENPESFTYTIAVINFIAELKDKNIIVSLYNAFEEEIKDMVFREASNYIGR